MTASPSPRPDAPGPTAPAPLAPVAITGEDAEAAWLRDVYRGDRVPQLTFRALAVGGVIGAVMSLSNLYLGLKTGNANGVAITACLVCFSVHGALLRLAPKWFGPRMSILEANAMQTTASAAGFATGSTLASAIAAHLLLTQRPMPGWLLVAWTFCTSALGAFLAIPLKRRLINREQLPFPTGTAAATTLRVLHEREGGGPGARALAASGLLAAGLAALRDGFGRLPATLALPWKLRGLSLSSLTVSLDVGLIGPGIGAVMGLRIAASLLLGAAVCYGVLVPTLHASGALHGLDYGGIIEWSLWPGTGLLVGASLAQLLLQSGSLLRGVRGLLAGARSGRERGADPLAEVELPRRWFWTGVLALSLATLALARVGFSIPLLHGAIAVALSFVLGLVSCRVTGETDTTPPLGQVTQLAYSRLMPGNLVANLMTSSITSNSSAVASDLLSDLKSGYLLGADPRRQFLAQLAGCAIGTAVAVPCFYLLVPNAAALGGERFPAPAAQVLLGLARALNAGLDALPPPARWAALSGLALGGVLALAEALLPPRWAGRLPSPLGLGLAFMLPASWAISIFLGGLAAWAFRRVRPVAAEATLLPAASGLIAGESLVAVALTVFGAL